MSMKASGEKGDLRLMSFSMIYFEIESNKDEKQS